MFKKISPTQFIKIMLLIADALNKKTMLPSFVDRIFLQWKLFAGFWPSSFCSFQTGHILTPFSEPLKGSVARFSDTPLYEESYVIF